MRFFLILLLLILAAPVARAEIPLLDERGFKREVLQSSVPVIVQFEAAWCPYCRKMQPRLQELKDSGKTKMKIVRVDVDQERLLAAQYDVRGLPTFVIFHQGEARAIIDGALSLKDLAAWAAEYEAEFEK